MSDAACRHACLASTAWAMALAVADVVQGEPCLVFCFQPCLLWAAAVLR